MKCRRNNNGDYEVTFSAEQFFILRQVGWNYAAEELTKITDGPISRNAFADFLHECSSLGYDMPEEDWNEYVKYARRKEGLEVS